MNIWIAASIPDPPFQLKPHSNPFYHQLAGMSICPKGAKPDLIDDKGGKKDYNIAGKEKQKNGRKDSEKR